MKKKLLVFMAALLLLPAFLAGCKTPDDDDDAEVIAALLLLNMMSSSSTTVTSNPTDGCADASVPTLTKGAAVNGTTTRGQFDFYKYTAAATESNTYTLTPSAGDHDLLVGYANTALTVNSPSSLVESYSMAYGTSTDSVTLTTTRGDYRCVIVIAQQSGSYSLVVASATAPL